MGHTQEDPSAYDPTHEITLEAHQDETYRNLLGYAQSDIDELLDRIDFTGWGSAAETPDMLRELLRQWNSDSQTKDLVTDLLVWVTGADGLDDGQRIIVEPMDDAERLPEAATCTLTLRLPPLGRTVGAAAAGNGVARLEEKLRLAMAHSVFGVQ